jgi:hypothetical protein
MVLRFSIHCLLFRVPMTCPSSSYFYPFVCSYETASECKEIFIVTTNYKITGVIFAVWVLEFCLPLNIVSVRTTFEFLEQVPQLCRFNFLLALSVLLRKHKTQKYIDVKFLCAVPLLILTFTVPLSSDLNVIGLVYLVLTQYYCRRHFLIQRGLWHWCEIELLVITDFFWTILLYKVTSWCKLVCLAFCGS